MAKKNVIRAKPDTGVEASDFAKVVDQLAQLTEQVKELSVIVKEENKKFNRRIVLKNIKCNRITLEDMMGISSSTFYRWKRGDKVSGKLKAYTDEFGNVYYKFAEVFRMVQEGKLFGRRINNSLICENMIRHQIQNFKGNPSEIDIVFEDED